VRVLIPVAIIVLVLCSCGETIDKPNSTTLRTWPSSTMFIDPDSLFSIRLSGLFQLQPIKTQDTVSTIYGKAYQDVYFFDRDSLSMLISVTKYAEQVQKRPDKKIFESSVNTFLHSLGAKRTKTITSKKHINKTEIIGDRTFFTFRFNDIPRYGVTELYRWNSHLYQLIIISNKKDDFTTSDDIALAFHSFQPI